MLVFSSPIFSLQVDFAVNAGLTAPAFLQLIAGGFDQPDGDYCWRDSSCVGPCACGDAVPVTPRPYTRRTGRRGSRMKAIPDMVRQTIRV